MIKTWKVWGAGLTTLYIIGKDVDEVLAQARLINSKYNSVQLYCKEGYIMGKSCWSCKHCINDYFATGTMDCKKQDDMTEDEFENYYGDNGGENCPYYDEDTREDYKEELR